MFMVGNEARLLPLLAILIFPLLRSGPENYAGFGEMVNTTVELRRRKQTAEECTALLKKSNY